jgi:hypothetical protein
MLSSRLNAFVIPISQTTAIAMPSQWLCTSVKRNPPHSAIPTAPNCPASLATGGRWSASSRRPKTNSTAQPARMPSICLIGADESWTGTWSAPK